MTPEELDDLLCQYGAQLRAWPVEHQRAVTALLWASPQARERVREMRRLEAMIADGAPELEPPPGMLERVERTLMGAALKDWKPPAPASARGASASVFFGSSGAAPAQPASSAAANSDTDQIPPARGRRQVPEPHRD
ncbi:hypothetical protein [Nitrospirillum viridazoti]|uniref:Uncharacterized protein n=1 Tax=Nitrospirillum viridazoti CBAmc TaxID=1441467 RepID=A0A248JWK1_9PROT|nr:hypothetical protein [Nitrospirillum amazonense]ASG23102.1 hypothetical protein Y958_19805 [Nitrospirillum amazonense CBAmc]TWB38837.1 hypothetical protein FBZ91_106165 [Nitrospirillum amazonense]